MIEIGGKPILWHIMKIYSAHGINDFIVCLGYKGYVIKEYFANYFLHMSDVTFDMRDNSMQVHQKSAEPWRVTLVDTGEATQTGGRLKRVAQYLGDEDFCFTYGDGVADVEHPRADRVSQAQRRPRPRLPRSSRRGVSAPWCWTTRLITSFQEKPKGDGGWINGGFFVLSPDVIDYIDGDDTVWEREPLERLARDRQLAAYFHRGFWQPMDTLRDKNHLEELWAGGNAPWKAW